MGFSRQEYWSGVPLPSLLDESRLWSLGSPSGFNSGWRVKAQNKLSKNTDAQAPLQCNWIRNSREGPAAAAAAKSLQSCSTLWDPIDSSPPGSPVPGILQARVLEWVAIAFSREGPGYRQLKFFFQVILKHKTMNDSSNQAGEVVFPGPPRAGGSAGFPSNPVLFPTHPSSPPLPLWPVGELELFHWEKGAVVDPLTPWKQVLQHHGNFPGPICGNGPTLDVFPGKDIMSGVPLVTAYKHYLWGMGRF